MANRLTGPLSLGDDAADLARRNLDRIKSGQAKPSGRVSRPASERSKMQLSDFKAPVDFLTDFIPGVGEAKDVVRAGKNIAAGNYGAAAIDGAAAVAGVVPGIGDVAAKGIRNFHGFDRARQRVPDLVPDQNVWNTVNDKALKGEVELGGVTRRDKKFLEEGRDPGQLARNASIDVDGKKVPVVVVPHKNKEVGKYHIITTRDRGRGNKDTSVLGGREYAQGGKVGGK